MAQDQQVKNYFKAPEGRYLLHSERATACPFVPTRPVRLTFAAIQHQGSTPNYVIYNLLDRLAFCYYATIDKVCKYPLISGIVHVISGKYAHAAWPMMLS